MASVNICGIPHEVEEVVDPFDGLTNGQIIYGDCRIQLNAKLPIPMRNEALCHEMLHGILLHLGYNDLTEDEHFVQCLANAINNGFSIRWIEEDNE